MRVCGACGTENPPGHKFCGECGATLAADCPVCGAPAVAGFKFCGECGTPLAGPVQTSAPAADAARVVERRVCSVLFADLVGFTPLSEARDPEEVRDILSRYFDTARTVITRYGGTVEKFIGDAVMAVWGTPVAAEGDAERAVRAGLDLVASVSALGAELGAEGLAARAGVVTGEVAAVLGAVGEGMVAGDAVNTAARVQAAAGPGTVWVDDATHRLAAAGVGFADAGEHPLKGKAEPARLWCATRVLSSVGGIQRVDGLEAPMVGRAAEERTLRELFHACAERRAPRLVVVSGAPGAGKSRLGWEFEKYVDGLADTSWWHRGRCLTYGDGVAHWALAEAMRQRFEIADEDPSAVATTKFLDGLDRLVEDPEQRSYVGVRLGRLLGITHPDDTDAALGRDELFAGWRLFLELLAESAPVIVLIEDAQHADDSLLDFLIHVVEWSKQAPVFLVVFARSELLDRRPELAGGRNRTSMTLDALDERSMFALVDALVRDVPRVAATAIVEHAQGNPMFAVETVRSLIDRDVIVPVEGEYRMVADIGTLSVPDSLHGLLAARLDALDPQLRALVSDAAVLGSTFPPDALIAVSGRPAAEVVSAVAELVHREILDLSADPLSPQRGSYGFSQDMLRQVAYETLSRRDRRSRHLAVAEHLQQAFADGGEEVMDVVAQHYLDALDAVSDDDDDEVRRHALTSLVKAGDRSRRAGAMAVAARSYARAAGLLGPADRLEAARLWALAMDAYGNAGRIEDALAAGARARDIYQEAGAARSAARALADLGSWLATGHRQQEARATLEEALVELRSDPDADTVRALGELASNLAFSGAVDEARAFVDEALGLAQAVDVGEEQLARLFGVAGLADLFDQRPTQGIVQLRYAAELGGRLDDHRNLGRNLNNLANAYLLTDAGAARDTAREAVRHCRMAGDAVILRSAMATVAEAQVLTGEWTEALAEIEDARANDVLVGDEELDAVHGVLVALRGDPERARAVAPIPETRASDDAQDAAYVAWLDVVLATSSGDPAAASAVGRAVFASGEVYVAPQTALWTWPLALRGACSADDLAEAHRMVEYLETVRRTSYLPPVLRASLALARARLGELDGAPAEEVEAGYVGAVGKLRAAGSPYHLAHGLLDHAAFLGTIGRHASALRAEAEAIGERLGAVDIARRTEVPA